MRANALVVYGGKCACCDERDEPRLTMDHVNGDGATHRKELAGRNLMVWLHVNNFPSGFQVLCMNCNFSAGHHPSNICIHQRERLTTQSPHSPATMELQ
jgi:hypothetical protein